jgi:hypothetical protein
MDGDGWYLCLYVGLDEYERYYIWNINMDE